MGAVASQITSLTIVYSTVYSGVDKKKQKHESSVLLAFVTGEFPAQMDSNTEMFPFDDVIMRTYFLSYEALIIKASYGRNIFEYICANTIFVCCWKCDPCLHIDVKDHWFNGFPRW